eukprot:4003223-Alexandrium_andersonii.AAC.1
MPEARSLAMRRSDERLAHRCDARRSTGVRLRVVRDGLVEDVEQKLGTAEQGPSTQGRPPAAIGGGPFLRS